MTTKKHPGGRPTKITTEVTSKILAAVRGGNYIETAAQFAGISKETLYAWLRRGGNEKRGPYKEFSDALYEALATAEISDINIITQAAKKDWRAAAWRQERRNPQRWGRKDRTPLDKGEEEIRWEDLTDEELEHVIATGELPKR